MTRVITILIASLLIVGCSNKGFHKRQYKNRMWINHGFTKKENKSVDDNLHSVEKSPTKLEKYDLKLDELEIKNTKSEKQVESKTELLPNQNPIKNSNASVDAPILTDKGQNQDKGSYLVENSHASQEQIKATNKSDRQHVDHSGIVILLLVIIALIIPPLAVLLYEGATSRFLLNLLLSLLYLLVFVNPIAALCGLLAVIHAILIVIGAI